jgi:hypothetical protein
VTEREIARVTAALRAIEQSQLVAETGSHEAQPRLEGAKILAMRGGSISPNPKIGWGSNDD